VDTQLLNRQDVPEQDTWNLKRVFKSDAQWEKAFAAWSGKGEKITEYRGKLSDIAVLVDYLSFDTELEKEGERLMLYVYLKSVEDLENQKYQLLKGRFSGVAHQLGERSSFVRPELLALPKTKWNAILADPRIQPWKLNLQRLLRYKPHTLSAREERILAMSSEIGETPSKIFQLLNDADLEFKSIRDEKGKLKPLTHETFQIFLHSPKRSVRKQAFHEFYRSYEKHRNSFASILEGSVRKDVFYARSRNFQSSIQAALFGEHIPVSVYDHLIAGVHKTLPVLYRYYDLRRRLMKLRDIHFYDTYTPILNNLSSHRTWDDAVAIISEALAPLGAEYVRTLRNGLTKERWADRYENKGKASGAFSYPSYDSSPYIMINYKPDVIESVFTLIHEGGHSMHSWYSAKNQPFQYYDYVIFLAEIASTFNEVLLSHYFLKNAENDNIRAWFINREIDAIRATVFRQTMFSEFEQRTHEIAEKNEPLTVDILRSVYRELLDRYFGPKFTIDEELSLECLRIPHFYRAFYVYKYATGMSAAIALAERVLHGGRQEQRDYLGFLKSGCSAEPLDILRSAGVDMEKPDTVNAAMKRFETLVDELEKLLG